MAIILQYFLHLFFSVIFICSVYMRVCVLGLYGLCVTET